MKFLMTSMIACALWAMTPAFGQVNIGLKFGANYNFNGYKSDSLNLAFNNAASFSGGALVRIKIQRFHVQAEGLFVGRKGEILATGDEKAINFYAFDLPLLIGYSIIDLKAVKVRLNGGVIPSFTVSKLGDLEKANFQDSFYSVAGGISLDIPLFLFDLRYQGGIGDYYQIQNVSSKTSLTNSMLTLSVAWKIL